MSKKKVAGWLGGAAVDFSTGFAGAMGVGLIVEGIKRKNLGVTMCGLTTTVISIYAGARRACEAAYHGYEIFSDVIDYED